MDPCGKISLIITIAHTVFDIIQIGVPVILIVVGGLDMGKAIINSKEDEIKKAQKLLVQKIVTAALVFLLVPLLSLVIGLLPANEDITGTTTWKECWDR